MKTEELVARALRLIQVIDARQPVKASDMQTGIAALNGLVRRWEANTLSLGWSPVSNPSDDLPLPDEALDAAAYNLALRLAPEYGVDPAAAVVQVALETLADLRRDQAVATPIRPILDAPIPASVARGDLDGQDWYVG